jgi:hypothetical protein
MASIPSFPVPALFDSKATLPNGDLKPIYGCDLIIGGIKDLLNGYLPGQIIFNNLPDIGDSKGASYNDEAVPGRSLPIKAFSQGENRSISVTANFYIIKNGDEVTNLKILRAIQSAVYPRDGNGVLPFKPPPICKLRCGKFLSANYLCVVMRDYNVKGGTDVPWHITNMMPSKLEVSMSFDVVYPSSKLPGQEQILSDL